MEDHQTKQQQSSESNHSSRRRHSSGSNPLLSLLLRHPWLAWSGVWVLLLSAAALISSIAILSIVHTGQIAHEEQPPPVVQTPSSAPLQNSETSSTVPLWVLGAVVSCAAAGYLMISRRLNNSSQTPTPSKPAKRSSTRVPKRRQRQRRPLQKLPLAPTPPEPIPTVTPPVSTQIEPMVTVLPPEENHPLDENQESLAEMMDIRKQKSLSSILGETLNKE